VKKKKLLLTSACFGFFILLLISITAINAPAPVTVYYNDITFPSTFTTIWQPENWNLNLGSVIVSYTLDLVNAPNVANTNDYSQMGLVGLICPGIVDSGARMGGFLADWNNAGVLFPTFPDLPGTQDIDDKFNLQKFPDPGSWDEKMYDVEFKIDPPVIYSPPIGTYNNYGIWFDRDGVDQWQAASWGMVDGGTYNTEGVYPVQLTFNSYSTSKGIVYPRLFPELTNTWDTYTGKGIGTGFYSAWHAGGPDYYPTGISFDSDSSKMAKMRVYIAGSSGPGMIIVKNIKVTGYLGTIVIDGCDTGVVDKVLEDGATISGRIQQCALGVTNHGKFVSCVANLTNYLMKAGYITGKEKGTIQSCAARANIPPK
jgi:hypothetical protein